MVGCALADDGKICLSFGNKKLSCRRGRTTLHDVENLVVTQGHSKLSKVGLHQ